MDRFLLLLLIISYLTLAKSFALPSPIGSMESESPKTEARSLLRSILESGARVSKRETKSLLRSILEGGDKIRTKKDCAVSLEMFCAAQEAMELINYLKFLKSGDGPGKK